MERSLHLRKYVAWLSSLLLASFLLFFYNCGGGYSNPQSQITSSSVLVSPSQLNEWITNGYGTDAYGFNKMVVLDVASSTGTTSYSGSGHVPNAFILDTSVNLSAAESDGVSSTISEVATTGADEQPVAALRNRRQ